MGDSVEVGDIVLYTNLGDADGRYPPEQIAAIVTKVRASDPKGMNLSLAILYPTGLFFMDNVPFSQAHKRGHWSYKRHA